jgi:hypothetical protein
MEFVDTPFAEADMGKSTPRAFYAYDHEDYPNPATFVDTITNSFPTLEERALFCCKYYQLLFYHRHQMKTKALMVVGEKDSGKTTIVNPVLRLIPPEHVASITKENQFSCSMIDENTQLTFVDEFTEDRMDGSQAKNVIQGGFMVTANKHTKARTLHNRSQFYFTAQKLPHWGADDENVKRRLEIFTMKKLQNVQGNVASWLTSNWFECLLWVGLQVRENMDILEARENGKDDLFFFYEDLPVRRNNALLNEVSRKIKNIHYTPAGPSVAADFSNELLFPPAGTINIDNDNRPAGSNDNPQNCSQSILATQSTQSTVASQPTSTQPSTPSTGDNDGSNGRRVGKQVVANAPLIDTTKITRPVPFRFTRINPCGTSSSLSSPPKAAKIDFTRSVTSSKPTQKVNSSRFPFGVASRDVAWGKLQ